VALLRKSKAFRHGVAENIGAEYPSFAEMLKQWEDSAGHRENLLMAGAKKIGVASWTIRSRRTGNSGRW
jgi:uncharacterized protein YkwD